MSSHEKRYTAPGTAPGTLSAHPERQVGEVSVTLCDIGPDALEERSVPDLEELEAYRSRRSVTWIDVVGLHEVQPIERLGEIFELHPLALEDVLNTGQRPKVQEFDAHLFIILQVPSIDGQLDMEQVSFFVGEGWIITLRERPGPLFEPVLERLRRGGTKIRERGADYLAYALVDVAIDQFFPLLETMGDRIDGLQDALVDKPERDLLDAVQDLKSDLLDLRHVAWAQREVFDRLTRREFNLVGDDTRVFFQDCYDHTVQILDMAEYHREMTGGMVELYLTGISHRTNEVMKVLTIMASIFIPLTFITGVYGMNFNPAAGAWSMPELNTPWGYAATWLVMVAIGVGMLLFFRHKRWL